MIIKAKTRLQGKASVGKDIRLDDSLVLYYDAGNRSSYSGTGTTWYDLSPKNNNGTFTSNPSSYWDGNVLNLDGTIDLNTSNLQTIAATSSFTVNMWTQTAPDEFFNLTYPISITIGDPIPGPVIDIGNAPYVILIDSNLSTVQVSFTNTAGTADIPNTIYNLTVTYNGSCNANGVDGYINGELASKYTSINETLSGFIINNNYSWVSFYPTGKTSIFQIYNRVLTPLEIKQSFDTFKGRFGIF